MENITVKQLIELLDKDGNKRGGATGKERIIHLYVNDVCFGYITSAKLDGFGDGIITDVGLEFTTEQQGRTNREVLINDLQNRDEEGLAASYISCPYTHKLDCEYDGGSDHTACIECKNEWLDKEWEG